MNTSAFFNGLRRHFEAQDFDPASPLGWVLSALRQEPVIWDEFIGALGDRALSSLSNDPHEWTPAAVALLALDFSLPLKNLQDPDWVALEPADHLRAEQAYETWTEQNKKSLSGQWTASNAGLVALALRERVVFYGNWHYLETVFNQYLPFPSARPVAACLIGMAPDPDRLLAVLFQINPDLGVHAFLCRPAAEEQQASDFAAILNGLPEEQKLQAIPTLARIRPGLAQRIPIPDAFYATEKLIPNTYDVSPEIEAIQNHLQKARALLAVGQPAGAIQLYQQALHVSHLLQGFLTAQTACAQRAYETVPNDDGPAAALQSWEQALQLDPENLEYASQYAWALLNQQRPEEALVALRDASAGFSETQTSIAAFGRHWSARLPFLFWGSLARLEVNEDNFDLAETMIECALDNLILDRCNINDLLTLGGLAMDLESTTAAQRLFKSALEIQPNHSGALQMLAELELQTNQPESALLNSSLARTYQPEPKTQRLLIRSLQANQEWSAALDETKSLIGQLEAPAPGDWRLVAVSALQAGQVETAIQACNQALHLDPQDGLAVELLGEIALSEGKPDAALHDFESAAQLCPDQASPWLKLAAQYQRMENPKKSLEILRQASQTIPGSVEIHLSLGKALLNENSPTLALIPLRQAARLAQSIGPKKKIFNTRQSIALVLGGALRRLGFLEESRQAFEEIYPVGETASDLILAGYQLEPETVYAYAKTLLGLGETALALPWLSWATTHSHNLPANLDYSRAILSSDPDSAGLLQAISLLETILASKDEPHVGFRPPQRNLGGPETIFFAETYALLAESLRATGELDRALDAYRHALNSDLIQEPTWRRRLSLGLGQVAMSLGQSETAIAAFLEAIQVELADPLLFRGLSEAYEAIDLLSDAYQAASQAARLDQDNPDTLRWFSDLCLRLYNRPQSKSIPFLDSALEATKRVAALEPCRASVLVRLAYVLSLRGDREQALVALEQLSINSGQEEQDDGAQSTDAPSMLITLDDLRQASDILCNLDEPALAAQLLQQAIQVEKIGCSPEVDASSSCLGDLYLKLSQTYQLAGDLPAGLNSIEQALKDHESNVEYLRQKSIIQLEIGDLDAAIASLENILSIHPLAWECHVQIAFIYQALGKLRPAIHQMECALECLVTTGQSGDAGQKEKRVSAGLFIRWLAATFANEILLEKHAQAMLDFTSSQDISSPNPYDLQDTCGLPVVIHLPNACLQAEFMLRASDLEGCASALADIIESAPHDPHLLALQSRLVARQEGVTETSLQLIQSAANVVPDQLEDEYLDLLASLSVDLLDLHTQNKMVPRNEFYNRELRKILRASKLHGLTEAALELKQWPIVEKLIASLHQLGRETPAACLLQVRALVLRAETQRLCSSLSIIQHAPGPQALKDSAQALFKETLLRTAEGIDIDAADAVDQVIHWRARGQAVFSPEQENGDHLLACIESSSSVNPPAPDALAALVWSLGQAGQYESAVRWSQKLPNDLLVNVTLALALSQPEPDRALLLVQQALDRFSGPSLSLPGAYPILYALEAILVRQMSPNLERLKNGLASIETALAIWPDEPRWHSIAAQMILNSSFAEPHEGAPLDEEQVNQQLALEHLKQAASQEPNLASHHLKLGQFYEKASSLDLAIQEVEKAVKAEPGQAMAWLYLAQLQKNNGDLEKAIANVERALSFTSQSLDALLLRSELALMNNNPRGAVSRLQAILNINPDLPKAWYLMAKAQNTLGQLNEALVSVEHAIQLLPQPIASPTQTPEPAASEKPAPQNPLFGQFEISCMSLEAGAPLEMQRMRVHLLHDIHGATTALVAAQALEEIYPQDAQLNALQADCLFELGDPARGMLAARQALQFSQSAKDQTDQEISQLGPDAQAHLHLMIGAQCRLSGQLDQAIYHLNEAISKSPDQLDAYLELGRAHIERRQTNQALEIYQMASKIAPQDFRPYYQAGLALKDTKDYLQAETMFRRAAHLAPNEVIIHRQLAAVVAMNLVHNRRIDSPTGDPFYASTSQQSAPKRTE